MCLHLTPLQSSVDTPGNSYTLDVSRVHPHAPRALHTVKVCSTCQVSKCTLPRNSLSEQASMCNHMPGHVQRETGSQERSGTTTY